MLALVLLFPALGAIILALNPRMPNRSAAIVGVGSIGLSALATLWVDIAFMSGAGQPYVLHLWDWGAAGGFHTQINLYLDGLSVTMISVVTGVGFLIHLSSSWYLIEDLAGGPRY